MNDQIGGICPCRSDLFSLGTVILEVLNLEHMDILYEKGFRKVVEGRVQAKIREVKDEGLKYRLSIILSHEGRDRDAIYDQYRGSGMLSAS